VELTHESLSIDNTGVVSSVLLCIPLFWVNDLSHGARSVCGLHGACSAMYPTHHV